MPKDKQKQKRHLKSRSDAGKKSDWILQDKIPEPWQLVEGRVNENKEHIKLFYGKADDNPHNEFIPVACVAKGTKKRFIVQYKTTYTIPTLFEVKEEPIREDIIKEVRNELNYFLIELHEEHPWDYAIYHCGAAGNWYSTVHWAYYPMKKTSRKRASGKKTMQTKSKQKTARQHKKPAKHTSSGSSKVTQKGKAHLSKRRAG